MTGLEALQTVQFINVKGQRLAVLGAEEWKALIEWIENFEDAKALRQTLEGLKTANGVQKKAEWLELENGEQRLRALFKESQSLHQARTLTDDEIAAEVADYRSGR
ncbi:MAG: hypothetical protein AB7P14_10445 [Blastocatellales bacterium]